MQLAVPASASMKQVKEALAIKLNQPEVTRKGAEPSHFPSRNERNMLET